MICISNNIHLKLWDMIIHPRLNFNVDVIAWVSNYMLHKSVHVAAYSCHNLS